MKPNDFSQLGVLTEADFSRRSPLREERHPEFRDGAADQPRLDGAPPLARLLEQHRHRRCWSSSAPAAPKPRRGPRTDAAPQQPWQRAAQQRRLAFMLLTVLSTVIASTLFARVQPDYDNVWLEYGQIGLYGLLSGWVVTGFVTALMGFYVSVRGDKHALSAKQVADHPMNPDARTAIIMPICNEDVATVFAGLRATCESVAATGHAQQFDVFVLSDSYDPGRRRRRARRLGRPARRAGHEPEPAAGRGVLPPAHPPHPSQGRQRGRLLPPLGQGLPLHGRARRRQRDERRLPDLDGQADGSQPDAPASSRPPRRPSATSRCTRAPSSSPRA